MNAWERLGMAWRLLVRGEKAVATMLPTWQEGEPTWVQRNFPAYVEHGYRKNELIYACIAKRAGTASMVSLRVHNAKGDELPNHPVRRLLRRPNPIMGEEDLWAAVQIYSDLAGVCYFEKVRSEAGRVVQLWPLRPDRIKPIRSSTDFIAGYEYHLPGGTQIITLDRRDVISFQSFDPLDLYGGLAPVQVAARSGDVDNSVTDFLKLFFEKGGIPPGLLKTKKKLIEGEAERIRAMWAKRYGGVEGWLQPIVLDSDAEYQKTGSSFQEMGFEVIDGRTEVRICMVLRVPPIMIGAKVGLDRSTFANYAEARRSWWEDDLVPAYRHMRNEVAEDLLSEYGEDLTLRWDLSQVPALREEEDAVWKRAGEAFHRGAITRNQFFDAVGLPEIGPAGDVYLVNLNQVEVPAKTARAKAREAKAAENAPDDDERRRHERKFTGALNGYLQEELDELMAVIEDEHGPLG